MTEEKIKILIVDDAKISQLILFKTLKNILENYIEVDMVDNGLDAIELAKPNKYDIIFMDFQMPVMNGFETINKIRSLGINSFISLVTADNIINWKEKGADFFIRKPFDCHDIYHVLQMIDK